MAEPLPVKYAMSLYRGDTRVWQHNFNDDPPAWAPSTAYVAGTVGSKTYLANSTVTVANVKYTCTTAHTSSATFDATFWTVDKAALGAPIDITDWIFEATYRLTPDSDEDVAVEDCEIVDGPGGVMRRTLTAEQAALLPAGKVAWDLQAAKPDGTVKTYLFNDGVKVTGDVTR